MIKEEVLNVEIGKILRDYLNNAEVLIEESHQLQDASQRPDIVISRPSREAVLIEHKIDNQQALLKQCRSRLGGRWVHGSPVRVVVGLLSPVDLKRLKNTAQLGDVLRETNQFKWILWWGNEQFPGQGWLGGSLQDFAGFLDRIGATAVDLSSAISRIKIGLNYEARQLPHSPLSNQMLAKILKQEESEQTTRMALAIILNAAIFHIHVAEKYSQITHPQQMLIEQSVSQVNVGLLWRRILEINYVPIFKLAYDLLVCIRDPKLGSDMIRHMFIIAQEVSKSAGSQGLVGTIFGELIKDRKLLASFYTMPTSAILLAELAVDKLEVDWSESQAIKQLRIADLAIGTGTLLLSVYRRLAERYMLHSQGDNDPSCLHQAIMEEVMIGCDVDPAAIHITAARLAGEYPEVDYHATKIYAMPFGLTKINGDHQEYKIGSLDLLIQSATPTLFGDGQKKIMPLSESGPPTVDSSNVVDVLDQSLDMVIMNPPFTRPTGHEGAKEGIPVPSFAALGNDETEQREMSDVLSTHLAILGKTYSPLASHGNAGLASNFADLAHIKLKPRGVLALVLPITFISGNAWSNMRALLAKYYQDIVLVSVSSGSKSGNNWSSDTALSEILLIASKATGEVNTSQAFYAILDEHPKTVSEAVEVARAISQQVEEGEIHIGDKRVGHLLSTSFGASQAGQPSGIANTGLISLAEGLLAKTLILPRLESINLPMVTLGDLGEAGAYHADISGLNIDKSPRGAFDIHHLEDRQDYLKLEYPTLWSHDTKAEKLLLVSPDSRAAVRAGCQELAAQTWSGYQGAKRLVAGATKLHINRDLSMMSQSLGACLTPVASLGGHVRGRLSP